ncbi:MAG: hypothetical protein ACI9BO_001252 [Zhongshania sp.]|jgi:hypothetical protein
MVNQNVNLNIVESSKKLSSNNFKNTYTESPKDYGIWVYDIMYKSILFDKKGTSILGLTIDECLTNLDLIISLCPKECKSKIICYFTTYNTNSNQDLSVTMHDSDQFSEDMLFFGKSKYGKNKIRGRIKIFS